MLHPESVCVLKAGSPVAGRRWVLYWMQQSQRARCNPALEHAVQVANAVGLPVLVAFGLTPSFPEATAAHYAFMLAGLRETARTLRARGIGFTLRRGDTPPDAVLGLTGDAALAVADRGYLRVQRGWRDRFAAAASCPVTQVEGDLVVPVAAASPKEEVAAATLRPKLHRQWERYLVPWQETETRCRWSAELDAWAGGEAGEADGLGGPVAGTGGRSVTAGREAALERLTAFTRGPLKHYHLERSDPGQDLGSGLSPYLHFGQVSPLEVALAVRAAAVPAAAREAFLEELLVRRELAANFVHYNPRYDRYDGLPAWCRATLAEHAADRRPYRYRPEDLAAAATHDPYWNAAQTEVLTTGRMHGYMRMYWGKKILEWAADPEAAFALALELNNRFELDGRDPNGFAGVAWCFGKHDRPWMERPVFGKIRYMNSNGLCRKFDMPAYLARVGSRG